ncbi:MAG: hypothetical protein ABI200_01360 [Gaiellales bacterium]
MDLAVILGAVAIWAWYSRGDSRAAVGHDGLHGSVPPAGQRMPDLSMIRGISPGLPAPRALRGDRVLLVATCLNCRSGDIVGGALRRLGASNLPSGAQVVIAGWRGTAAAYRAKWSLPSRFVVHVASPGAATTALTSTLHLDADAENASGYAFLYDTAGRWRSTFPAQLMLPEDIVYDTRAIG